MGNRGYGLGRDLWKNKHYKKVAFKGRKIGGDTIAKLKMTKLKRGKGNKVGLG